MNHLEINEAAREYLRFLIVEYGFQASTDSNSQLVYYQSSRIEVRVAVYTPKHQLKLFFRRTSHVAELEIHDLVQIRTNKSREYDQFSFATLMEFLREHYKKSEKECIEHYFMACTNEIKEHGEFYGEILRGDSSAWFECLKQKVELELFPRRYELLDLLKKSKFVKSYEAEFSIEDLIERHWLTG